MVLFIGPLYSGKHAAAEAYAAGQGLTFADLRVCENAETLCFEEDRTAELFSAEKQNELADALAMYDIVLMTAVGGGLVPVDPVERAAREDAGRLSILLAERADKVIRVFCGIAKQLK